MKDFERRVNLGVDEVAGTAPERVFFNSHYVVGMDRIFLTINSSDVEKCARKLEKHGYIVDKNCNGYLAHGDCLHVMFREQGNTYDVTALGYSHTLPAFSELIHEFNLKYKRVNTVDIRITQYNLNIKKELMQSTKRIGVDNYQNNIPELYPKINVDAMIKTFLASPESILVLTGSPGTGKTTLIKMIIYAIATQQEHECNVMDTAYIKDQKVLREQVTWTTLHERDYPLIVLDDLDNALLPRKTVLDEHSDMDKIEHDNMFVNQLLSYSDGIFEPRTKIIITTNQPLDCIDKALLRPGRCFDILEMVALSNAEALHIWKDVYNLPATKFHGRFGSEDDVTQAQLVSYKNHVEFMENNAAYLNDESISSKRHFLSNSKAKQGIGFL